MNVMGEMSLFGEKHFNALFAQLAVAQLPKYKTRTSPCTPLNDEAATHGNQPNLRAFTLAEQSIECKRSKKNNDSQHRIPCVIFPAYSQQQLKKNLLS